MNRRNFIKAAAATLTALFVPFRTKKMKFGKSPLPVLRQHVETMEQIEHFRWESMKSPTA